VTPKEQAEAVRLLNQWRRVYDDLPLPARVRCRDLMNETIHFIHTDQKQPTEGDNHGS
jgi:hypothetical protein